MSLLRVVGLRPLLVSPLQVVGAYSYELSCLFASLQRVVGQRNQLTSLQRIVGNCFLDGTLSIGR